MNVLFAATPRDLELRRPVRSAARACSPLFATERGEAFTDTAFSKLIMGALRAGEYSYSLSVVSLFLCLLELLGQSD